MRSPAAERNLRRLVTKLAAAEPDDVELVLEALEPAQRREVRNLLDAYSGPQTSVEPTPAPRPAPEPEPPPPDASHLEGLSPWLGERIAAADGPGSVAFRMTPASLAAAAELARALPMSEALSLSPRSRRRGLGQLFRRTERPRWA